VHFLKKDYELSTNLYSNALEIQTNDQGPLDGMLLNNMCSVEYMKLKDKEEVKLS
jgi:hypothetical protein